jgi:glycosyltransferase involved in cell wall biosynthesis
MVKFTIAIPTKNRPELAKDTYYSIINSTYSNYEILVLDNDEDGKTTAIFNDIRDKKVRVVRTGGLSMPDNWEQAFINARGDYILVVGNKYRISPYLLENVAKYIKLRSPSVICTELSFFRFPSGSLNGKYSFDKSGWAVVPSQVALDAISQLDFETFFRIAPFGYKAIISMKFVRETQHKYGRFAFPVAPDFAMGYLSLLLNEEYHAYNRNHTSVADNAPSNGLSDNYDGPLVQEFRSSMQLGRSLAEYSPIPEIEHGYNLLVSDFFYVSSLLGKVYPHDWLNPKNYFIEIFRSLMVRHLMFHLDVSRELKLLYSYAENKGIMWSDEVMGVIEEYNHRYMKVQLDSLARIGRGVSKAQRGWNQIKLAARSILGIEKR